MLYSRKKVKPSYAENYFKKRILLKFQDKDFIREHPIGYYFADFAWLRKKKVIEIDGKQHLKKSQADHDKSKDRFMKKQGWKVMRIKFANMLKNPNYYLKRADLFIGPKE